MAKYVGVLTAGGDSPGLNAALRGIGKAAIESYGMQLIGFKDGFRGLMQDRIMYLESSNLSGILTLGGTILGTSRDKPNAMPVGGKVMDMTDAMLDIYKKHHLDVLICLGGGGTQKSALKLMQQGINVITLPKTIDNDVARTDVTFGFDTALGIATEAIDRLHSTAHSHHRIILVEVMGHRAGWLALGAGIAGGADVILTPEIPYDINRVAEAILRRSRGGKHFSIVAVSEGAMSIEDARLASEAAALHLEEKKKKKEKEAENGVKKEKKVKEIEKNYEDLDSLTSSKTLKLARQLEALTGLESRVTILGHLQRGGAPSAGDRLLATRLGTACAALVEAGQYGTMVASRGDGTEAVPLEEVAGNRKIVPLDHPWIESARRVGTCLGDL
ncbi:MAG: ATP-dependent 6-phosphofructokinase [Anaerolineae bacterium]|nr:ATP-dependent 6-phosphofructokinase [Anaerolineae bacterium]